MKAVVFHDIGDVRLEDIPEPKLKEPTDAIVRITTSAICGTDLHMIRATMPGMVLGDVISAYKSFDRREEGWIKVALQVGA